MNGGKSGTTGVAFHHPETVRFDERFELRIDGLPAGEQVRLEARMDDKHGVTWESHAVYDVEDGTVVVDEDEPVEGTFETPDTMALVQTMQRETGDRPFLIEDDHVLELELRLGDELVETSSITRTYGDPDVVETELDGDLVGVLFEPPGDEAGPGALVLHGSDGRPMEERARMLASNGFVALALHYFDRKGQSSLPRKLAEIPVEYVDDAAGWLLEHDRVVGSSVGAMGLSRGTEIGLLAASHFDNIGSFVSLNGSALVWEPVTPGWREPTPTWTVDGEPVPEVPHYEGVEWDQSPPMHMLSDYQRSYEEADPERIEAATIPVERIDGPVFFLSGGDDQLWDSQQFSEPGIERLEAHDHPHEYEHLVFEDAGHAILTPYRPTTNRQEGVWVFGGTPSAYAEADVTHWERLLEVLRAGTGE